MIASPEDVKQGAKGNAETNECHVKREDNNELTKKSASKVVQRRGTSDLVYVRVTQ